MTERGSKEGPGELVWGRLSLLSEGSEDSIHPSTQRKGFFFDWILFICEFFQGKDAYVSLGFPRGSQLKKYLGLDHLWYPLPHSLSVFCSPRTIRDLNLWLLLHWAGRAVFEGALLILQGIWPFAVLSGSVLIGNDSLWEESISQKKEEQCCQL